MSHILIIFAINFGVSGAPVSVTTQRFNTVEACRQSATEVRRMLERSSHDGRYIRSELLLSCVPDPSPKKGI